MKSSNFQAVILVVCLFLLLGPAAWAQMPAPVSQSVVPAPPPAATVEVPRLIKFSGTLFDEQGQALKGPVGVTFALYAQQTGGAALWLETQNIKPDASGNYTVLLGANSANGVPAELFVSGEARWLGIQAGQQPEHERILLVSVPYALKAGDAETLGGKPLSSFVLNEASATGGSAGSVPVATSSAAGRTQTATGASTKTSATPQAATPCSSVTSDGTATTNSLGLFTTPCNIEGSLMSQVPINGFPGVNVAGNNAGLLLNGTGTHQVTVTGATSGRLGQDANGFFFSSDTNGKSVRFLTNNGTLNEWMRITSAGNIGVGTTTPLDKLDVNGGATIRGQLSLPNGTILSTSGIASAAGVTGQNITVGGIGVYGNETGSGGIGVEGSAGGVGVEGLSGSGTGVLGQVNSVSGIGVHGVNKTVGGLAGRFDGPVAMNGSLTVTGAVSANGITASTGLFSFGLNVGSSGLFSAGPVSIGTQAFSATFDVAGTSGVDTLIGDGCSPGFAGIGFLPNGTGFSNCNNYAMLGDTAGNLYINNRGSGSIQIRNNNNNSPNEMTITSASTPFGPAPQVGIATNNPQGTLDVGGTIHAAGDASQALMSGGWVKAMAYVDPTLTSGNIVRCFNAVAANSIPPCGFTYGHTALGQHFVFFNFEVDNRFVLLTPVYISADSHPVSAMINHVGSSTDTVAVTTFYTSPLISSNSAPTDTPFYIAVF